MGTTSRIIFALIIAMAAALIIFIIGATTIRLHGIEFDLPATISAFSTIVIAFLTASYVYTSGRQLDFMTLQLVEAEKSRDFQAQPLPIIKVTRVWLEKPRLYYTPPEDKYSVKSRYHIEIGVENFSPFPAVNVAITAQIEIPGNEKEDSRTWGDSGFFDTIQAQQSQNNVPSTAHFMYTSDDFGTLIDVLRKNNYIGPRGWPRLTITAAYKNVLGGCFVCKKAFYIHRIRYEDAELMKNWQSEITTYSIKHDDKIKQLKKLQGKDEEAWDNAFDSLKAKLAASFAGSDLDVQAAQLEGKFSVNIITKEQYAELEAALSYGTLIPNWFGAPMETTPGCTV